MCMNILRCSALVFGRGQLNLDAVYPVDAVDEQDQDEDEGDLYLDQHGTRARSCDQPTFMPYCNFATSGFSEMKVKSLRFMVYGSGTMRAQKMPISNIRSTNT